MENSKSDNSNLLPFEKRYATKKVVIKKEGTTNSAFGKKPAERTTEELLKRGLIILNKPSGPTSHQAADYLKKVVHAEKAGHSGTLDPGVTGVLPIALQDATRITQSLLTAGKEYVCLMHIHGDVTEEQLRKVMLKDFMGTITQLPPKKSAVKRQNRQRTIYYMDIIEIKERDVLFRVGCQAGTYIRKLVHDMGLRLGGGAHMVELIRTKAGPFKESEMVTLQDIADAYHYFKLGKEEPLRKMLKPIESAVQHMKKIWIFDDAVTPLCHGAFLKVPGISKLDNDIVRGDPVAIMTLKEELVLVGEAVLSSQDILKLQKGIAVKTMQVFMQPEMYKNM
ncbi:MAG: RNA-guided pseudouridylation complex pseudouridine synthase subunit Cbf5 [Candidatus Nanoarchaeia archaeon]